LGAALGDFDEGAEFRKDSEAVVPRGCADLSAVGLRVGELPRVHLTAIEHHGEGGFGVGLDMAKEADVAGVPPVVETAGDDRGTGILVQDADILPHIRVGVRNHGKEGGSVCSQRCLLGEEALTNEARAGDLHRFEVPELGGRIVGRSVSYIFVNEVMHRRGTGRNRLSWTDQRVYGVGDAAPAYHVDAGDLDDVVAHRIGARGFDVDDADQGSRLQSPVQRQMLTVGTRKSTERG
jgi:hypothetical protein